MEETIRLIEKYKKSIGKDIKSTPEEVIAFERINLDDILNTLKILNPKKKVRLNSLNPEGIINYSVGGRKKFRELQDLGYRNNGFGIWVEDIPENEAYF